MTMPDGKRQQTSLLAGLTKAVDDSAAFNSAYFDATRRSGRLGVAGLQDLGQRCFGATQDRGGRFQATVKALSLARSVGETRDIQAAHLSTEFEQSVKQATDLQEAALQLVRQASAPLIDRLTVSSATATATARGFQS